MIAWCDVGGNQLTRKKSPIGCPWIGLYENQELMEDKVWRLPYSLAFAVI